MDLVLASGCSVWVAKNDKGKVFGGKPLGDGCLDELPNMGLSPEATKRISLIDIIWIKQNAPLYAFEVEVSTSVYSGLLRMSDLISVVPALNVQLFIVAPKERQEKVMDELRRPTFQKIRLSNFSRFIPAEDLYKLAIGVERLRGYVSQDIINTIALDLPNDPDQDSGPAREMRANLPAKKNKRPSKIVTDPGTRRARKHSARK